MYDVARAFVISDIQSSPVGDERSNVRQLCQKQHNLLVDVGLKFERAEMQMIIWMCGVSRKDRISEELEGLLELSRSQLYLKW